MLKRLLCALLCLIMLQNQCLAASAEEFCAEWENGYLSDEAAEPENFGQTFQWRLTEDGTLMISGLGDMPDFGTEEAPWWPCRDRIFDVLIAEGVTGIGRHAFDGLEKADTVVLGQDVERIGEYAFRNCRALRGLSLPELTSIPAGLFYGCESLQNLQLPESILEIGTEAFYGCAALEKITLPENLERIGARAFASCRSLQRADLPEGVTVLPEGLFRDCAALEEAAIPTTVTSLERGVFDGCASLRKAQLPEGITGVAQELFRGCGNLEEISIPEKTAVISEAAFAGCRSLKSLVLPAGVTEIGDGAFQSCKNLKEMTLPQGLKNLGSAVFQDCSDLEKIALGENLTGIPASTFSGCEKLKEIELPDSIETIGGAAFENCGGLEHILLPDGMKGIGIGAFSNCESLTEISVPDSVSEIGRGAFSGCGGLEKARLPGKLERLEEDLFRYCEALREVGFPETMTQIGAGAFYGCKSLKISSIPVGVVTVGKGAFSGCDTAGIIDLSNLPERIEEETVLDDFVSVPEKLTKVSGGKSGFSWSLKTIPGEGKTAELTQVNGKRVLRPLAFGRILLVCEDVFTGICSERMLEICSSWEIQPEGSIELVSGEQLQFRLVAVPSGKERPARWSVEPDRAASITEGGLLTANAVEKAEKITVTAVPDVGEPLRREGTVLPGASEVTILMDGKPVAGTLEVDLAEGKGLQLSASVMPEDARKEVLWLCDNAAAAEVNQAGQVTLRSPGNTVIRARCTDGSHAEGTLGLLVYYRDKAAALTLQSTALELDPGQTAQLTLMGEGLIAPQLVDYTVSGEGSAAVDELGCLTAGDIPGEITVTAVLRDDPLERRAELTMLIREDPIRELRLVPEFPDDRGYFLMLDGEPRAHVDYPKLEKKGYVFRLKTVDERGREVPEVLYGSSDESLAAVSEDGTVMLQAKREGECDLTVRMAGDEPLEARLHLTVADTSPRLETGKLTINSYREAAVSTGLVENYGNTIEGIALLDYDSKTKTYGPEPSRRFRADFADGSLSIEALEVLKNGTYPVKMRVSCGEKCYEYILQLKVANSLPKVDVRQAVKFNLFYLDTSVPLAISAAGCRVERTELTGADSFQLLDASDGGHDLYYADGYVPGDKISAKGTLRIFLEGYRCPVERALTVVTENKPPKITMTPGTTVLRNSREKTAVVQINTPNQDLSQAEIQCISGNGELTIEEKGLKIRFTGEKSGVVQFTLRLPYWASALKLSHRVTVESRDPTVKLGTSNLKLNRMFPRKTAVTTAGLTQQNGSLQAMTFRPSAKAGTASYMESEKLRLVYDPAAGTVTAQIKDPKALPKNGTYGFSYNGILSNGTVLPAGSLKVKVESTLPKAKLAMTSVKMNAYLAGKETVQIPVTLSDAAYRVAGFRELGEYPELRYENGTLTVCLTEHSGKTAFLLTPIVEALDGSGQAELPGKLKLGLTVYRSEKLEASLSAGGKLDTLVPESTVSYTVTRLSNCLGKIEDVTLTGRDADAFRGVLDTSGVRPVVQLTLRGDMRYETQKTYRLRFRFSVCGKAAQSPEIKVKVSQSSLKVTAAKSLTCYLGQRGPIKWTMVPSAPVEAITLNEKTDKNFREALGEMTWSGNQVLFQMAHPEKLKAGKSYVVLLDITPVGNAADVKPTQVRLTVRAAK